MVIIGAKGLAKELLTVLSWNKSIDGLRFFDDVNSDTPDLLFNTFPVLKSWKALKDFFAETSADYVLGVGGTRLRKEVATKATTIGGKLCSVRSHHAFIGDFGNTIGNGCCILNLATITCDVQIGEGCLINKGAIISHDVRVGRYCCVSPGAKINGWSKIGNYTLIGTNAVVLPGIRVGSNCIIGAGAVVTRDVPSNSTVVGVPAKSVS